MASFARQQRLGRPGIGAVAVRPASGPKPGSVSRLPAIDANGVRSKRRFTVPRGTAGVVSDAIPQPDRPVGFCLDEEKLIADMAFPIKPAQLIEKTKYLLEDQRFINDASTVDEENFVFTGPVVGPLVYKQLQGALANFNVTAAFPIWHDCYYHFRVDPYIPGRVWFTSRSWAVNTGTLMGQEPTNKVADAPPQNYSFTFNEDGKVIEVTVGYVQDRRIGNQGGLGGVFGMFYAVGRGLPFPEAQPWKMSFRYRFFQRLPQVGKFLKRLVGRG